MLDYKTSLNLKKLTKILIEVKPIKFKKLLQQHGMNPNTNQTSDSFWEAFTHGREKNSEKKGKTFESIHYFKTRKIAYESKLKLLAKTNKIRFETDPLRYCVQDVDYILSIERFVQQAEKLEIQGDVIYQGKKKYKVIDGHQKGMSFSEYQINVFDSALKEFYSQLYDFIPKK